jgi:HAD superfamily hydrolase (TIGR01509 family)
MIRAVLFDLDDTLVDHQHASRAALAGVRTRFAALAAWSLDELVAANQRILDLLHADVALGRTTADDARIERYRRLFALAGAGDAKPGAAAELHRRTYQAMRRRVAGALELVTALRARVPIAVVTNNTREEQTEKLATFGFAPLIHALVTSEEVGAAKPDARIFATALSRVGCTPSEAVMVGDSWHHDVEGAVAAGLHAVWLNRNGAAHPDPAVALAITSLAPAAAVAEQVLAADRVRTAVA